MKKCKKCNIIKDESSFHKNKQGKNNVGSVCKQCRNKNIKMLNISSDRRKIDRNFLLSIKRSIKNKKSNNWEKFTNFSFKELMSHLERQFSEEMSWENYSKVWCIDFIIPRSAYSYKNFLGQEFRKCWSLKNMRPLLMNKALGKTLSIDKSLVSQYHLYDILPIGSIGNGVF